MPFPSPNVKNKNIAQRTSNIAHQITSVREIEGMIFLFTEISLVEILDVASHIISDFIVNPDGSYSFYEALITNLQVISTRITKKKIFII